MGARALPARRGGVGSPMDSLRARGRPVLAAVPATAPLPLGELSHEFEPAVTRAVARAADRWMRALGAACLVGVLATTALIVVYAGSYKTPTVPPGPHIATYLHGVAVS